jgi:hypothetical protein
LAKATLIQPRVLAMTFDLILHRWQSSTMAGWLWPTMTQQIQIHSSQWNWSFHSLERRYKTHQFAPNQRMVSNILKSP